MPLGGPLAQRGGVAIAAAGPHAAALRRNRQQRAPMRSHRLRSHARGPLACKCPHEPISTKYVSWGLKASLAPPMYL